MTEKELREDVIWLWENSSSYRDFKISIFNWVNKGFKR